MKKNIFEGKYDKKSFLPSPVLIIFFILILLLVISLIFFVISKHMNDSNIKTVYFYETSEGYFQSYDKKNAKGSIISSYICESDDCISFIPNKTEAKSVILDNETFVYDFKNEDVLEKKYIKKYLLCDYNYDDVHENCNLFYLKYNDKYGIIDLNGDLIHEFNLNEPLKVYEQLPNYENIISYSVKNNLIIDINDEKYGISKIFDNEMVVDYLYDDLLILNDKYFKAKIDNKWYLYSLETKEKVLNIGYDDLSVVDDILIVEESSKIHIKNLDGINLVENGIPLLLGNSLRSVWYDYSYENNVRIFDKNMIRIYVNCFDTSCPGEYLIYYYNILDNILVNSK